MFETPNVESRRPLRYESPESRRDPFRVQSVDVPVSVFSLSRSFGLSLRGHAFWKSEACDSRRDFIDLMPESALDSRRFRSGGA